MSEITLHNYKTRRTDSLPSQPEDWRDYIPQDDAAQGMYTCYLQLGKSPLIAAGHVLAAVAGQNFVEPTS